jgi:hypothetical protein
LTSQKRTLQQARAQKIRGHNDRQTSYEDA